MKTNKAKRLFVAIVTMLLLPVMAAATPATLSIEEFTISAGETKEMIIDLNNPSDEITLVQFDLRLPAGLSIAKEGADYVIDIVGRTSWRKHSLDANTLSDDVTRFLLSSNTNAVISGTSGAFISITLTASSTFNGGIIKLENQLLVTPSAVETKPADYSYTIPGSGLQGIEVNATNFPDANFRNWVLAQTYGADGVLTDEEIAKVTKIDVRSKNISDLKGIEYFTALKSLDCGRNLLTALDISKNTALTNIWCHYNQIATLDISKNTALTYLQCISNQLKVLDVSKNTALTNLYCSENKLTTLDLSKNTALTDLDCSGNQLTALDVSMNTALIKLFCNWNQLTALDVSKNTILIILYCDNNKLTTLDVSKNSGLQELNCYSNQINETEMGKLVESLPTVNNGWFVVFFDDGTDGNVITTTQVAAAKAKGWEVKAYDYYWNMVDYDGVEPSSAGENITFADAKVKALCVANWDTNGDGELSKAEAAAVTDLGQVFKNNTEITSFDELQYFTGLTKIYNQYFFRCTNLQRITIPNSVTIITANSFYFTENLASIIVAEGNTKYDSRNNCNAIISSSTNTLIVGCKNTIIPNSVTIIGSDSFWGCRNLNNITIPNGITTIQSYAFYGCSGLTSLSIPKSVTSIEVYAFTGCGGLTSINVVSGNTKYDSRNNCNAIVETATNILIKGCKNTIIPNNIVALGNGAFSDCTGLTSIVLPNSLTSIGEWVFDGCNSLASIDIPSNVSTIGRATFQGCTNLTSITLPNNLTKVEPWTFNACTALTAISIPELVSDIGEKAFYSCNKLTSVTVKNPVPANVAEDAFPYRTNATLYVPIGSKGAYQNAIYWRDFKNIVETSTGIESVNSETITDNRYYTLDGRLVENPDKGIYIVNGHKVVIK